MRPVADAARGVSGQVFGARGDDLQIYSQPRPIATLHKDEGWTPASILGEALPLMSQQFYSLSAPSAAQAPAKPS